jgi:hypothetical protein
MVRLQTVLVPEGLHAPFQPAKMESESAMAVKLAVWPYTRQVVQLDPQVKPAPVIVPLPEPDFVRFKA